MPFITINEVSKFLDRLDKPLRPGSLLRATYVAQYILHRFMGLSWAGIHISNPMNATSFLSADLSDPGANLRQCYRIIDLAELLFNMQNVPGIVNVVKILKNGDIEAAFAELYSGKILINGNLPFLYITPDESKHKGIKNPDIILFLEDRTEVYCEVERKLETTEVNFKTVYNTIKHAKNQLPRGKIGIVMLMIPDSWLSKNYRLHSEIGGAIQNLFRQSKRVLSIIVFGIEYSFNEPEGDFLVDTQSIRGREYINYNNPWCKVYHGTNIQERLISPSNSWINLQDI